MHPYRKMKLCLVWALLLLTFSATGRSADAEPINLFDIALDMSVMLDPQTDPVACRNAYAALISRVKKTLDDRRAGKVSQTLTPRETIAVLNKEILIDRQVSYISNVYWRDSLFTSALMKNRGNCVSTSLLYFLAARDLKLPVKIAHLPRHAMVRWVDEETTLNIETTAGGRIVSDDAVMKMYELTPVDLEENEFLQPMSDNSAYAHLLINWAAVLESLDRPKESAALLEDALKRQPQSPEILLLQAHQLSKAGNADQAETVYRDLLKSAKGSWLKAEVSLRIACLYESRGRFKEAMELLLNMKDAPVDVQISMLDTRGALLRHNRDFEPAIKMYEMLVTLKPCADTYNELGSVLTEAHKDPEAIAAYEKALKFNPEDFFTKVILAGLYERSGDKEKGRALFAKIEEPRENKQVWYCALVWYYANINEERLMLENMERSFERDASGRVYHYFVREPDLDPYRDHEAFVTLMKKHIPTSAPIPVEP